ncbi:unnamed protein product [Rhizoctonia solani]|uniref:Uncharacterized protein n=1 Tax=Rhizoctonia solani TaxID=456999 RepID=A0A8H3GZ50_9AGAM|nr:unnamed protein product [Rhizoctonia solani]CAE6481292.1 unnamed protein product [Rhizoctonia solani]
MLLAPSLEIFAVYGGFRQAAIAASNYVITGNRPANNVLWGLRPIADRNGTTPTTTAAQNPTTTALDAKHVVLYYSVLGPEKGKIVGVGVPGARPTPDDFLRIDYDPPGWRPDPKKPEKEYEKQKKEFLELMKKRELKNEAPFGIHFNAHYVRNGDIVADKTHPPFAAYIDMGVKTMYQLQEEYNGYVQQLINKDPLTIWNNWRQGQEM